MGDSKCGKSSLAQKYLDTQMKDDVKETIAMDYHQGSKLNEQNGKVNINIQELGRGRQFKDLLEASLVASGNLHNITVCIFLDLEYP